MSAHCFVEFVYNAVHVARAALCADDAQEQIAILDRFAAVLQIGQCRVHSDGAQMRIPHVVA